MPTISSAHPNFSLAQARGIVKDLFTPNAAIYWADFLTTIIAGHAAGGLVRGLFVLLPGENQFWLRTGLQALCFFISCMLYYRAVMFVHELVHLPEKKFRVFRVVWNLLCGIPFLTPSFTYYPHLEHHRRKTFGTHDDGEYLALARLNPWYIVVFLLQGFYVPPLAILRFLVLTPLTWFSPALRKFIHQRASTLVMDPSYIRPLPTDKALRIIRMQEVLCFLFCLVIAVVPPVFLNRWPIAFLIQAYATAIVLITMNSLRTAAAHRWTNDGHEMTFVEQMQDSVTLESNTLPSILINPVGLRFHALHHLFPSLPYHAAGAAHRRLMAELPADSPYRSTVEKSILATMLELFRRAAEFQRSAVVGREENPSASQQAA